MRFSALLSVRDGLPRAELSVEDEGLGPAIVRSVADRHGASLRIDVREHGPALRMTVGFVAVP